jgi:hypothetical protein
MLDQGISQIKTPATLFKKITGQNLQRMFKETSALLQENVV